MLLCILDKVRFSSRFLASAVGIIGNGLTGIRLMLVVTKTPLAIVAKKKYYTLVN